MKRTAAWTGAIALVLSSCTTVNLGDLATRSTRPQPSPAASPTPAAAKPGAPFKAPGEVLKDTRTVDGLFKLNVKRDNTVYATIAAGRLETDFGLVMHFSSGNGTFDIQEGLYLTDTRMMRFVRAADKIHLVHRNTRFTAEPGSAMEKALADNVGHSIVQTFDIAALDSTTGAVVIDLTPFLVSDYANIAERSKNYFPNEREPQFVKASSWVDRVQGFPRNVEIDAMLSYHPAVSPQSGSAGLADTRWFTAGVRYSLFALPDEPMASRAADTRLGYFVDAAKDFSRDTDFDPMVRNINRWRLEKKDPSAGVSEPVKPITYYIDWSVPDEYRQYVKEGVEGWNKAFEAAGFRNAIVALDPPKDDSTWSAEDIRHSTIRWTAAYQMGYAIGPSQTDPRSGEILNADILLSSEFVSGWSDEYADIIGPEGMLTRFEEVQRRLHEASADAASRTCFYNLGLKHDIGLLRATLVADGAVDDIPIELIGAHLRSLTLHEVGHTLGLMHNFESSQAIPFERLHDRDFTRRNGVVASVMDYDRTNINPDRAAQGFYSNPEVGAYDVWVIQYGYTPFAPGEEAAGLAAIASRSSEPLLTYGSHEDLAGGGIDPYVNVWDLSDDLLAFARSRAQLVGDLEPRLEARLIGDGEYWNRLRGAYNGLLFERYGTLVPVAKLVGGVYFSRDHKGTPNARAPMVPVPADEQKEAVRFIIESFLADGAVRPDADRLNRMPPSMHLDWNTSRSGPIDVPIHATLVSMQGNLLASLTNQAKLARMIDNELRMPRGADAYTVAELFQNLTAGIWTEIRSGADVSSIRRNLQRAYIDRMGAIVMNERPSPAMPSWPEDARALARLELGQLLHQLHDQLQADRVDRVTKAHYLDSHARIGQALEQSLTKTVR
jgi:hypothetical protein